MISCPACAKPKSNAPHPQNNEHTLSRPADIAYTTRRKKKKKIRRGEVSERIARNRERRSAQTAREEETERCFSLRLRATDDAERETTHRETPNIEKKPNTQRVPEWKTSGWSLNTYLLCVCILCIALLPSYTEQRRTERKRRRSAVVLFRRPALL